MKRGFLTLIIVLIAWCCCVSAVAEGGSLDVAKATDSETFVNEAETEEVEATEGEANGFMVWIERVVSMTPEEWDSFINDTIVPWLVLAIGAVSTVISLISPILKKVKEASADFAAAVENIGEANELTNTAKDGFNKSSSSIEGFKKDIQIQIDELKSELAAMQDDAKSIEGNVKKAVDILKLGFGNIDELIEKGFSAQIAKAGGKDGIDENEEN